jgi:hypothetical protein
MSGKDDNAPKWDGKTSALSVYMHKIELWQAWTRVAPQRQAIKLLACIEGDAFEKMKLVKPSDLAHRDGVKTYIELLKDRYEPVEYRRVGAAMDHYFKENHRKNDETIQDFVNRLETQTVMAETLAGDLSGMWKAHLFVKKLRSRDDQEALILASAQGKYTVRDFKHAALSTFPTVASTRQGGGFHPPVDASRIPGGGGSGGSARFERKNNRFTNRAREAEQPEEPQTHENQIIEDAFFVSDAELAEMEAYITEPKKRRAVGQKAWTFVRPNMSIEERKSKTTCARCGRTGH